MDYKESYLKLFNNVKSGVVVYKAIDDGKNFIIEDFNPMAEKIEKIKSTDAVGKKVTEVFPGVEDFGLLIVLGRVWRTGKSEDFPVRWYKDNRIEGWRENFIYRLDENRVVAIYDDITQQKRIQFELKELRAVIRQVPLSIVVTDIKGDIEYVNPEFSRLTGYSLDEVAGRNMNILQSGKTPKETYVKLWDTVLSGGVWHGEFVNQTKSGKIYWEDAVIAPIFDDYDEIKNIIGIKKDVTAQKALNKKIKDLLHEKEALLKEVHHRIKNNFTSIVSILSLQANSLSSPEAVSALNESAGRVNSMALLYEKMLNTSDYQESSVKSYLENLVDDIVEIFSGDRRINVEKQIEDFRLSAKQLFSLGIILNELLTNVMKYAFTGRESGIIKIIAKKEQEKVVIVVEDNGAGLPEGFDLENQKGFGLMLVELLAAQLNGEYKIRSNKGTISTLVFYV